MTGNALSPILIKPGDSKNISRAAEAVGISEKTCRRVFKLHKLGSQAGNKATISVSMPALCMVVHNDFEALELLRSGDRHHPKVQRYFIHLGIMA